MKGKKLSILLVLIALIVVASLYFISRSHWKGVYIGGRIIPHN